MTGSYLPLAGRVSATAVGAILVAAGVAKAARPSSFAAEMRRAGLVPDRLVAPVSFALPALECGIGGALVGSIAMRGTIAAAASLIIALSVYTLLATRSGAREPCGCYGDAFRPTTLQSLLLNLGYLGLLAF